MGERAIENRIRKLKEIERQQAELEAQAQKLKNEIKADMKARGESEMHIACFVVRMKEIVTNRFDTKSFQEEHRKLYAAYIKPQTSIRFTIV